MDINPQNFVGKSQHSLRNSYMFDSNDQNHLNPAPNRICLAKKHSLSSKQQLLKYEQSASSSRNNNTKIRFDKQYQLNINKKANEEPLIRNQQFIIPLGSKHRENTDKSGINPPQTAQRPSQNHQKMCKIIVKMQQYEDRLTKLEYCQKKDENKKQSDSKRLKELQKYIKKIEQSTYQANAQECVNLDNIKEQISKIPKIETFISNIRIQQQKIETTVRETLVNIKNSLYKQLLQIENSIKKQHKRDIEILKQQTTKKLQQFKEEYQNNLISSNKLEKSEISHPLSYAIQSLTNNPYLRLKFLGKISLLGVDNQNPQHQKDLQRVQFVYRIDNQGYLLDQNEKYLMDKMNRLIKLNQEQISLLKDKQMFMH